jgi:Kelch motif
MSPIARWTLLSRSPSLARSSHCLSVTPTGRLFLYGGELLPRTPGDAIPTARGTVHSLNLSSNAIQSVSLPSVSLPDGLEWSSASLKLPTDVNVPDPRVGAASVTIGEYLYVWGGRGGIDMSPLPRIQAGIWRLSLGTEDAEPTWDRIGATNEEDAPQIRSYHAMTRYEVRQLPD